MNRTIRMTMSTACWTLAAALCAMSGQAMATDNAGASAAAEPQQLDEIWVYGKSLSRRIEDAEDKLFRRYNKVNRKHEFDVVCGTVSLQPGSMIMKRTCQPGFVADYASDIRGMGFGNTVYIPGYGTTYSGQACTSSNAMIGQTDMNGDTYWVGSGCSFSAAPYVTRLSPLVSSIPPLVVTPERREQYAKNFLKVVISDTKLLDMAGNLKKLYAEMDEVQGRYQAAKAEADARRKLERQSMKPVKRARGL